MNSLPPRIRSIHNGTSRRIRLLALLGVNTMAMSYTIHHILFEGARHIDYTMLVVEALVLFLVGYGEWVTFSDRRKAKKREKLLAPRLIWLAGLIKQGEQLRRDTPVEVDTRAEHPAFQLWIDRADAWSNSTAEAVDRECPKGIVVFNLMRPAYMGTVYVQTPNKAGKQFHIGNQDVLYAYERLVSQLANLVQIKENAEVYF